MARQSKKGRWTLENMHYQGTGYLIDDGKSLVCGSSAFEWEIIADPIPGAYRSFSRPHPLLLSCLLTSRFRIRSSVQPDLVVSSWGNLGNHYITATLRSGSQDRDFNRWDITPGMHHKIYHNFLSMADNPNSLNVF